MDREGISGEIQNVIERQGYHIAPLEVVREEVGNGFGYQLADLSQIPIGYDSVALGHTQSIKDPIRLSERTYSTFFIYKKGTYAIDWIMPLNDSGDEISTDWERSRRESGFMILDTDRMDHLRIAVRRQTEALSAA